MKRLSAALLVFAWTLAGPATLFAQTATGKAHPGATGQNLANPVTNTVQPKTPGTTPALQDDISAALQAVVQFLQLRPDQQTVLGQLLQARQQALAPLLQGIAQREERLYQLLESGGTPAEIGLLAIEIHLLQKQAAQVQQGFVSRWESFLDYDQQQRLQAARVAVSLQPIVPAFQLLQLL